jgi:hypothetical protein
MDLGAIDLTLGVRRSCAVPTPGFVLAVPADVAKLVTAETPADT